MKRFLIVTGILFIVNGHSLAQLTTPDSVGNIHPYWSPTGNEIAFASPINGNFDVYVIDLSSGEVQNMSHHPANDYYPSWSPNGKRLAYFSERERQHYYDLKYKSEKHQEKDFPINSARDVDMPSWSPDSRNVVYHSSEDGDMEIYLRDYRGNHI